MQRCKDAQLVGKLTGSDVIVAMLCAQMAWLVLSQLTWPPVTLTWGLRSTSCRAAAQRCHQSRASCTALLQRPWLQPWWR